MTDQLGTLNADETIDPGVEEEAVVEEVAEEAEEETAEDEDFWGEDNVEETPAIDPARVITLLPPQGQAVYAALREGEEAITITTALSRSQLFTAGQVTYYLNGTVVPGDTPVGAGAVVDISAATKGG